MLYAERTCHNGTTAVHAASVREVDAFCFRSHHEQVNGPSKCATTDNQRHSYMAHRIDDRWLWLGVGAAAFFAVKGIHYALSDIVRLTEIDPYQYEPKKQKEDHPEDSIKSCPQTQLNVFVLTPYSSLRRRPPRPGRQPAPQHRQRRHRARPHTLGQNATHDTNGYQGPRLQRSRDCPPRSWRRALLKESRERAFRCSQRRPADVAARLC